MRGIRPTALVACAAVATACSGSHHRSAPATSSGGSSVKKELYLTDILPGGNLSFTSGTGVIHGTDYSHSLLWSCADCVPVGQAGQQGQPGVEFAVPEGFNRLEFVAGLTDSSTETDRSAFIAVLAHTADDQTKLFESGNVTIGDAIPVSVSVTPGNTIRIDGGHLNGNETLCVCDPKLVDIADR
jgi:hypothetical protein